MNEKIIKILLDHKLTDLNILDLEGKSPFFDLVLISTGNAKQSAAVFNEIRKEFKHEIQNTSVSDVWTLIDLGSTIVHIFTPEARLFYNLDHR
jgi:ribosome-associated protein